MFVIAAWVAHSAESEAFAELIEATLRDCNISHKAAAIVMGVKDPVLTAWLKGQEQFSLYRLLKLGPEFVAKLFARYLREQDYTVFEPGQIADLITAVQALTERKRGAA